MPKPIKLKLTGLLAAALLSWPVKDLIADTTENPTAQTSIVCMRVEEVCHLKPRLAEPNRFPYLIELTTLKPISGQLDETFKIGQVSEFRIHSPARTFKESEDSIRGKVFKIEFVKSESIWVLADAARDVTVCGE